jgi:hypothetical protein
MALKDTMAMIAQFQNMDIREQQLVMQQQKFQADQDVAQQGQDFSQLLGQAAQGAVAPQAAQYNQLLEQGPLPEQQQELAQQFNPDPSTQDRLNAMLEASLQSTNPNALAGSATISGLLPDAGKDKAVFGQQLRGLGTDLLFLSQTYGGGKVPRNADQLEEMTVAASQDPLYGDKRQEWANDKTAGRLKIEGVAVDDPSQLVITDSKRGLQYRNESAGDTLKQQLTTATTEETGSLAVYSDLYDVSAELEELYDETLVGPFEGNVERMKSVFVGTPEFTKFKSMADRLRTIVYGFSGKQINETELVWLDGLLPKMYNPDENFIARLTSIKDWVADKQEAQLNEMRSARRFTGTAPLREREDQVSPERLKAFREKMDKELGVVGETVEPKRIRIKLTPGG